jgi:hypothetical protein
MNEDISNYLSNPSITDRAKQRETVRTGQINNPEENHTQGTFVDTELFEPEEEIQPTQNKQMSRGDFLRSVGAFGLGALANSMVQSYTHTPPEGPTQKDLDALRAEAETTALYYKTLNMAFENYRRDLEAAAFDTITRGYEIVAIEEKYFQGPMLIVPMGNLKPAPLIFNEISGEFDSLKPAANLLISYNLCRLSLPFHMDGYHTYDLFALKILPESLRKSVATRIITSLNLRYPELDWNLVISQQDSITQQKIILNPIQVNQIGTQAKLQQCECTADHAIDSILELLKNG